MKYDISVSDLEFTITKVNQDLMHNDQMLNFNLEKIRENEWLLFFNNKCFTVIRVLSADKPYTYAVDGKIVSLSIKNELDHVLERLGMDVNAEAQINEITAPMPGAILEVLVTEGQEVKAGDKLVILEAMKMENIIKSPVDGVISSVQINAGENVEKGHTMITF
jgi:biotin carboxyl carrier protein